MTLNCATGQETNWQRHNFKQRKLSTISLTIYNQQHIIQGDQKFLCTCTMYCNRQVHRDFLSPCRNT